MILASSVASTAPVRAWLGLDVLMATNALQGLAPQVSMLRPTANGATAGGLLPRRTTSAVPPFSTTGPSGRSADRLVPAVVHVPVLAAEKSHYVPLSTLQTLAPPPFTTPVP